ncbi:MAG: hypothetical protein KC466_13180, partial [Myxococcales bacterium]|nr:hypothetical protein [Myxococcales bacterium]
KFFYFAYIRKLASGEPLSPNHLPDDCTGSSTPNLPGSELCKCTATYDPPGCWMQSCDEGGTPGIDCKERCSISHLDGSIARECLPASVLYCANPTQSQSLTDETEDGWGVDVFEFNIAVARRESWDPSVGVVSASGQ